MNMSDWVQGLLSGVLGFLLICTLSGTLVEKTRYFNAEMNQHISRF